MSDDEAQPEPNSPRSPARTEFDFIAAIRQRAAQQSPKKSQLIRGIGDDAAVIKQLTGRETLVTADLLVEDIDFRRDSSTPDALGHKALAVSLSDLAAMGARPRWALLSLGIPQDMWEQNSIDRFYDGFFGLAKRYGVELIGGDISRSPDKLVIDSVVLGECQAEMSVGRAGAKPGDLLFVTGTLGGAAAGLRLLERGARIEQAHDEGPEWKLVQQLLLRHLRPEPRVGWGIVLGEERLASAMIDISDGLSSDLHHLCQESGVGALIETAKLPLDPAVTDLVGRRALDPLLLSLHGGEDFELLFTIGPDYIKKLPSKVDGTAVTCIGVITDAADRVRVAEGSHVWELEAQGWKHFG